MIKLRYLFLAVYLLSNIGALFGQVSDINITIAKEKVVKDFDGYGLNIIVMGNYGSDTILPGDYKKACGYAKKLNDMGKLKLIEAFTPYFEDYSVCGYKVKPFTTHTHGFGANIFQSIKYSIAIESMYLINLMFYGEYVHYLSNLPILFDKCTKKEVLFDDSVKILEMSGMYRKWYLEMKNHSVRDNFSMYNLFDLYRGSVGWLDAENIPNLEKIVSEIEIQVANEEKDKERYKNRKDIFQKVPTNLNNMSKPGLKNKK
ncbi:MAG: hypothetical protein LBF27_06855 [Sphingobacterium sp.]|jgi:hypothetical protein|nr:hypothetical protein [Sphingobacterium sp.]